VWWAAWRATNLGYEAYEVARTKINEGLARHRKACTSAARSFRFGLHTRKTGSAVTVSVVPTTSLTSWDYSERHSVGWVVSCR